MYVESVQCTVLEVKVVEGLGHTVDVVLVNGTLKEGDTIVVSTMEGPVVTSIRALLTPPPNREMRVKSEYIHHETLSGAIGIKVRLPPVLVPSSPCLLLLTAGAIGVLSVCLQIVAPDIGRAIAGTSLLVVQAEDDVEDVKDDVQSDLSKVRALPTYGLYLSPCHPYLAPVCAPICAPPRYVHPYGWAGPGQAQTGWAGRRP